MTEQSKVPKFDPQLTGRYEELLGRLQEALEATVFSNRFLLPPRRLPQIAKAETDAFLGFLETGDTSEIREQGAKRAGEGLGEQAMLRLGTTLRRFCRDYSADKALRAADVYMDALLEGFMEGREALILREQEQIHQALREVIHHYALQLATVAEVSHTASSVLDLAKLLPQVVNLIRDRFNFYYVGLFLLDESGEYAVLRAGTGQAGRQTLKIGHKLKVGGTSMIGWCVTNAQSRIALDVNQETARFTPLLPETRSEIALPLIIQGRVIGAMTIKSTQSAAFSQEDATTLQIMANNLANAIENARLYQQTDEKLQARVRELSALYAIAKMMNHSLELDTALQLALDSAIRLTGADAGGILLFDPSTNELSLRAYQGGSPEFILSEAIKDRRVVIEEKDLQSPINIPLKVNGRSLGVMVIASRSPRLFAPEELELLTTIGNQVGVAVDRANLQAQELRAAILEERQDLAKQMHDDIAQTLGYLGLQVDSVMGSSSLAQNVQVQAELEGIREAIEDAYESVRSSIMRLREDVPVHFDLEAALPEIINEFEKQSKCSVELRVDRGRLLRLSPSVAFQATHIIREALTNVRKHSGADSVHLTLQGLEDDMLEITIQDNGRGFDLDSKQQLGWGSFGLRLMRERAERVGGSLRIKSQLGQGTRVIVILPLG